MLTPQNLKDSDGVFSSSDSLDTDEVLGGVAQFNTPLKPNDNEEFSIKSRKPRGVSTDSAPPNTVSTSRRHVPRRHTPIGKFFFNLWKDEFCQFWMSKRY